MRPPTSPPAKATLREVLAALEPIEAFPEIEDSPPEPMTDLLAGMTPEREHPLEDDPPRGDEIL